MIELVRENHNTDSELPPICRATVDGLEVWVIAGLREARAALADPRLGKDARQLCAIIQAGLAAAGRSATELHEVFAPHMLFSDPPRHTKLRAALAPMMGSRRLDRLRPSIQSLVHEVAAALPQSTPVDLMNEFAVPLSINVICELLGIPKVDRGELRRWATELVADRPAVGLADYLGALIAAKRTNPEDDVLSELARSPAALSMDELVGTAALLVVAGHGATSTAIGTTTHALLSAGHWRQTAQRPGQLNAAVEDALRADSPLRHASHRYTISPIKIAGHHIPAGQIVLVALAQANRDESEYTDATALNRRSTTAHLAFGHGIHYCLGAPLARAELQAAIGHLTARWPNARLAATPTRRSTLIIGGWETMPVVLSPAPAGTRVDLATGHQ